MSAEKKGFQASLLEAKRHYATLPDDVKEDILSQITIANAQVDAYAKKRIDKVTGELIPIETVADTVAMCLTTLREHNITSLADHLSSQMEKVTTPGLAALQLGGKLRQVERAFQQKPGESPGGLNRIREAKARMAWLREQTRRKRAEDLKPEDKQTIMEKTREMMDFLTPSERVELYASSRYGTNMRKEMTSFDAFHDSLILSTAMLALVSANPLAIGLAAGTVLSRVKGLVMPDDPAKAFDGQLKESQRPSTEVRFGMPHARDGKTRRGGSGERTM